MEESPCKAVGFGEAQGLLLLSEWLSQVQIKVAAP